MRIVSHRKIKDFYETSGYEDSRVALERWYDIAEKAEWSNHHYVFNIRGNNYRLIVVVKFTIGYIYVRWIGTHKDYDKIDCSTK